MIGISAIGTAGDVLPMLEMGRRLEQYTDVRYLIFATDNNDYGNDPKNKIIRLKFDGNEIAKTDIDWMSPDAFNLIIQEAIGRNYATICHWCIELCKVSDSIINHYALKVMKDVCNKRYTSFTLCPGAINSPFAKLNAGLAIGKNNIIAVDPIFGGTGYYHQDIKKIENIEGMPVFMGYGSSQKYIPDIAMNLFLEIEEKIDKKCIIQGRDFDSIDHASAFQQCCHVIHHGGGTVHTATKAGVSQTIIPMHGEHLYWANTIEKLKLGFNGYNKSTHEIASNINAI